MEEPIIKAEEEEEGGEVEKSAAMSRKEKRKERKKKKRKQVRREIAEKERENEERKLNDPEEQNRAREMEEEDKLRMERERKEFEERERKWLEEMEGKRKEEEEEEERRKALEEEEQEAKRLQIEKENECNEDDDWEYAEEGPAEIIWQGNEIIVRKKRVKVPKKNADQQSRKEDSDRPTSNPLPPQSEAFAEYQSASMASAEQILDNVAQQVPNFGTEQDKAHCPFHLKTGACRFGQRCSRVHFYPDKACTLLMKNMYTGPGLAWEHDEGLEYTDEEIECCYEEFYEDVHTEFLKYGEIINFKVCKNSSLHLRGNVYVQYKSLDSAVLAYYSINGRYFAGRQVKCEFVNMSRWKVAICGEYMKSRLKTCSHGIACNFIHCFRNPGGDYEWADWDKPPPRYWVKKMAALFGCSDESAYEKEMEQEKFEQLRMSGRTKPADTDRLHARLKSRDRDHLLPCSGRNSDNEDDVREGIYLHWRADDDRKQIGILGEKSCERNYYHSERRSHDSNSDGDWSDMDINIDRKRHKHHSRVRKRSKGHGKVSEHSTDWSRGKRKDRIYEVDSDKFSDGSRKRQSHHAFTKSSEHKEKGALQDDNKVRKDESHGVDVYRSDRDREREKHHSHRGRSSRHQSKGKSPDDVGDVTHRTGSMEELLYREKEKGKHDHQAKKSSRHQSKFSDDHWDDKYGTCGTDSNDEWLDKESHHGQKRRCSWQIEQDISDNEGITAKRLEEKPMDLPLSGRSHSSRENTETISHDENLKPSKNHGFSYMDPCNGRYESYNDPDPDLRNKSIEEISEQDRWKPDCPDSPKLH